MKKIRINYTDFNHHHFDAEGCLFTRLLRRRYDVEISDDPEYLFYSTAGQNHHRYDCIRIFETGENLIPNFNYCDYAFGFHRLTFGDRYMRLPLWAIRKATMRKLDAARTISDDEALNRGFCATVIGNIQQTDGGREAIWKALDAYKTVFNGGRRRNNLPDGRPVADKLLFQRGYRFALAGENTIAEGYTTEKLLDAFASGCLPIYYGDPTVTADFNPDAFVNAADFASIDDLVACVKFLDENPAEYLRKLRAPVFMPGALERYSDDAVLDFLSHIIDQPYEKARRRHYFKPYQDVDFANMKARDIKQFFKCVIGKCFGGRLGR